MQLTETKENMLWRVLDQLMTSYTISAEELSDTHAYLFGEQIMAPFFTDKELFETVLYLRETVVSHELADLGALLRYYEERKRQMREYLTEIASGDDEVRQSEYQALQTRGLGTGDKAVE